VPDTSLAQVALNDAVDAAALRARIQTAVNGVYALESEIGRGGMAVVYAARDIKLRRTVALKVLPPDLAFRADVRARFVREAQTAAGLNHPNIVPIYAVDERDGMVYFAMSLIHGETLATRLIREPRPPFEFVESILVQVADALAYAHTSGVVHRDIKPDNILIDRDTGRATVTDFGIARALEGGARLTQTGVAVGTPAFMSPEQATGDREIDGRSDVYSLGVVAYLMVAGRLPFEASSTPAMLVKHVTEAPHSLREYRPDAPVALVAVIERCLAKKPEDRWLTAAALRDAVKAAMNGTLGGTAGAPTTSVNRGVANAAPEPSRATFIPNTFVADPTPPSPLAPRAVNGPTAPKTEAEWRAEYALGKRAEDWAPRDMPVGGSRRETREWRRELRAQRQEQKHMWKAEMSALALERGLSAGDARIAVTPPVKLIHDFRGEVLRSAVLVGGLASINLATSRHFWWFVFPAFGISMGLLSRYTRLRGQGISMGEILAGEPDENRQNDAALDPNSKRARMLHAVQAWRRHAAWAFAWTGVAAVSLVVGSTLHADAMVIPFVGGLIGAGLNTIRTLFLDRYRLNRVGLTIGDALAGTWEAKAIPSDTRSRDVRLRERAEQLVGVHVLESSLGKTVRSAVDDHATIKETSSKLTDADRMLVPDVEPTSDALLERISAIAGSLERLDRDMPGDAMADLNARIAAVEREPENAPDRERRIALLTRQKSSLQELADRRSTLERQFESASIALRSLRLDMMKLSALGMGALGDVTNATQEARALSKDIARALDAVDEVRKL
jgi:tRNA A-37 threonylcarbamoyl transferase component Bud32